MPTKTKPKPTEFFICIESFADNEFAVAEGTVLPGADERVQRCPDRFVALGTPDEEVRRLDRPRTRLRLPRLSPKGASSCGSCVTRTPPRRRRWSSAATPMSRAMCSRPRARMLGT
jgi:hypothetical protein